MWGVGLGRCWGGWVGHSGRSQVTTLLQRLAVLRECKPFQGVASNTVCSRGGGTSGGSQAAASHSLSPVERFALRPASMPAPSL